MRCVLLSGVRRRSPSATLTPSLPGWPLTSITPQPQLWTPHSYLFNTQIRPQTFNELKNNLQLLELSTLRLKPFSNRDTVLAYVTVVICKIDFSIFQTTFEIIILSVARRYLTARPLLRPLLKATPRPSAMKDWSCISSMYNGNPQFFR